MIPPLFLCTRDVGQDVVYCGWHLNYGGSKDGVHPGHEAGLSFLHVDGGFGSVSACGGKEESRVTGSACIIIAIALAAERETRHASGYYHFHHGASILYSFGSVHEL